jgi:hypothetical protein
MHINEYVCRPAFRGSPPPFRLVARRRRAGRFAAVCGVLGGGLTAGCGGVLCHHGPNHQRRFMSDIGIFSTWDIIVMILVACAPGLVIGAGIGAWVGAGKIPGAGSKAPQSSA